MDINELSQKSDINVRLLRKYKHIGLLSPAIGKTSNARYTAQHLREATRIRELIDSGCSLAEVHAEMQAYRKTPTVQAPPPSVGVSSLRAFRAAPGVTVTFDAPQDRIPDVEHVALIARFAALYDDLRRKYALSSRSSEAEADRQPTTA